MQQQQHAGDLGFARFRRMFLIHFYRDTVLAGRYGNRFSGHIEELDHALGEFLDRVSADTVKKLRLRMQALRNGRA